MLAPKVSAALWLALAAAAAMRPPASAERQNFEAKEPLVQMAPVLAARSEQQV